MSAIRLPIKTWTPGSSPGEARKVSAAFELGDEEHLAALVQLLEISGGVVGLGLDRDGGLLFRVAAPPRILFAQRLDDVAQGARLDLEFAPPAGIAAAEPARERHLR